MAGHGEKMDKQKELVITALLTERSIELAAKKSGIGEHTIYRWMATPEFDKAYKEAKRKILDHAISQIQISVTEAVGVLRSIMNDTENPASSRVSSAKTIIEQALKAVELEDVVKRVEELERIIEEKGA